MDVLTKEAIRADLLRIIRDLREDWDWSIEITDASGEELLYLVFWAGPKFTADGGEQEPIEQTTVH